MRGPALALVLLLLGPSMAAGAGDPRLDVVLDSTQHWVGANDVLFSAYDSTGTSLAEARVPLVAELRGPAGSVIRVRPAVERFATYGRHLYRAHVMLGAVGQWRLSVRADGLADAPVAEASLEVSADGGTPPLGSLAPGGATPTLRDARNLLHHISSDPEPLSAFYIWSLDEALAQRQATVFVVDSYAFRPNASCGGGLGILHDIFIDYPGLVTIHAEPWNMASDPEGDRLTLDPPGGPAVLTDYARAWGITEPPWVFVIDRDGRVSAKFTGVIGSDELRAALTEVTAWVPVGT
jgi:hypothetical protein